MSEAVQALLEVFLVLAGVALVGAIGFVLRAAGRLLRARLEVSRERRRKERVLREVSELCFPAANHPPGCICPQHRVRRAR